jgi:hypothetical protein
LDEHSALDRALKTTADFRTASGKLPCDINGTVAASPPKSCEHQKKPVGGWPGGYGREDPGKLNPIPQRQMLAPAMLRTHNPSPPPQPRGSSVDVVSWSSFDYFITAILPLERSRPRHR